MTEREIAVQFGDVMRKFKFPGGEPQRPRVRRRILRKERRLAKEGRQRVRQVKACAEAVGERAGIRDDERLLWVQGSRFFFCYCEGAAKRATVAISNIRSRLPRRLLPSRNDKTILRFCILAAQAGFRLSRRKCILKKVRQAGEELLLVFGFEDAVAFVRKDEQFVRDVVFVQAGGDLMHVLGGDVGVLAALHDEQCAADVFYEMDGGALAVPVGDFLRGAAHHIGADRAQVGAGGFVIDDEICHAADGGRRRRLNPAHSG